MNPHEVHDIDRSAPAVARQERTIPADPERVWSVQTDVDRWTRWRPDVDDATLTGDFAPGSAFRWSTGGLDIVSTIHVVEPLRRIVWSGPASGILGIHVWTFEPRDGGVHVVTEESWSGAPVAADPQRATAMLDEHLTSWLARLEQAALAAEDST